MSLQTLVAHNIPLSGKHLIEASAGTGKTYNITRLYLRLLLEKDYTVEQILVMTFTKDATEEIRGRIGEVLRESLNRWNSLIEEDEFYRHLTAHVSEEQAKAKLKRAILYLDEASIFTLHGFCKRVLSQYAFQSGLSFNLDMDTSGQDLIIEACQDWYRLLAKEHEGDFLSISQYWPHPQRFLEHFASAIGKQTQLEVRSEDELIIEFNALIQRVKSDVVINESFITEHLIDSKKGKEREQRVADFDALNAWLSEPLSYENQQLDVSSIKPLPIKFFDGRRFPKALKPQLNESFSQANKLKTVVSKFPETILKARAFNIVRRGIGEISLLIDNKKAKHKRLTFDDLISTLAKQLTNDDSEKLSLLLRQQFPVAMVDEFQDTDTAQFTILKAIYPLTVSNALYLIGDPKQAIYGFRGGDIFTYLSAREYCQYQWVMDTNWRSTQHMINGYNRLFYGNKLDDEGGDTFGFNIPYQPVKASPKAKANKQLLSSNSEKALQFAYFNPTHDASSTVKQDFRPTMALWCANKINQLLTTKDSAIKPQDIAILVRDGGEANEIKVALQSLGLTGVFLSNRSNLWHSEQAKQLLLLIKAILYVENDRFFVAGLASGLLPFSHNDLRALQQEEIEWQNLKFKFLSLREEWQYKGFIAMAIHLLHDHIRVPVLDHDRALTNIVHLFELLQSSSERYRQPQELLYWFEQQVNVELTEAEAELRLESDEDLIKIVTQHGSKGLEYPVVFVPFATRYKDPTRIGSRKLNVIHYHDQSGKQSIALGSDSPHIKSMVEEAYAESIRLLYVAVTRAEQQCYLLVANFDKSYLSPLGLTLKWTVETNIEENLQQLSEEQPNDIGFITIDDIESVNQPNLGVVNKELPCVPEFTGAIERDWWLSSFTALSKNLRHVGVSAPDRDSNAMAEQFQHESTNTAIMRFALTKGAVTGNLLHDIFEHVDFSLSNWHTLINSYFDKYPEVLKSWQPDELCQWLDEIVSAPLIDDISLKTLSRNKMLHEAEFYFPMKSANTSSLTQLLSSHRLRYKGQNNQIKHVQLPHYQKLKGMMHGFIDLIFEHDGKFYVCDYKSNYLGDDYSDYQQDAMQDNIQQHHYDLQYLIYSLALHRQLKLTVKNYDPELHFGGVVYCYLRGMTVYSSQNIGVFYRHILANELKQLDQLFGQDQENNK
jgi:exodeoxyribonuclease V beta subunit